MALRQTIGTVHLNGRRTGFPKTIERVDAKPGPDPFRRDVPGKDRHDAVDEARLPLLVSEADRQPPERDPYSVHTGGSCRRPAAPLGQSTTDRAGQLAEAWRYNPIGILATVAAAAATLRLAVGVITHRWLNVRLVWTPRRLWLAIAAVLVVLLEIRQQGYAELFKLPY